MPIAELNIKLCVDKDVAICEMFDIAEHLKTIVDLVPDYCNAEALKSKTKILNIMSDWIISDTEYGFTNGKEKDSA